MQRRTANLDYAELLHDAVTSGGFTVDLDGHRASTGYAVAIHGAERAGLISSDAIYSYVVEHGAELQRSGIYLGGWVERGKMVLDLVRVVDGRAHAERLARLNGQRAFYDFAEHTTRATPGREPDDNGRGDDETELDRELHLDEERTADEMEWTAVRGIVAPEF